MQRHGTYKLRYRNGLAEASYLDPLGLGLSRVQRIVESLRSQINAGGPDQSLKIRRVFSAPLEVFRVEIEERELHYHRTTLLDRDALEDLLETLNVCESVFEPD
jgi:hypothetical protein